MLQFVYVDYSEMGNNRSLAVRLRYELKARRPYFQKSSDNAPKGHHEHENRV
jgi:hypothetical protein